MKRLFALLLLFSMLPMSALAVGEAGKAMDAYSPLYALADDHGFMMGGCFSYSQLKDENYLAFMKQHFNSITCTNETKAYSLLDHKASKAAADGMPRMNYYQADKMVEWARDNGLKVRGHVLVWDAYMNDWFFRVDYDPNKPYADQETVRARTKCYIEQVITHFEEKFPGVIYCWDVVNEAIADNINEMDTKDGRHIRTSRSGKDNLFKTHLGDDYVEFSFLCAKDTVEHLGADIKLFYNDYSLFSTNKCQAAIFLIKSINSYATDENGEYRKLCDGIGMQGYIGGYGKQQGCMNDGDLSRIEKSIRMYADLGVEVHITEMAVRNYETDEVTVAKHAAFCGKLFQVFKRINAGDNKPLTCVAFWGIKDNPTPSDYSYRQNGPYCGLITEHYEIKTSFDAVHAALSK
ncbi:MAG: endo-1,4-beta-xylanase [Clostridia bacterium]|nr:endo-1,4-beta-xylanase [Clostridia bacterium]